MDKHTAISVAVGMAISRKIAMCVYRDPRLTNGSYEVCPDLAGAILHQDSEIVCKISNNGSIVQVASQRTLSVEYVNRLIERIRDLRALTRNVQEELLELPNVELVDLLEELIVLDRTFGHVLQKARAL